MSKYYIVECPECGSPVLGVKVADLIHGTCRSAECGVREVSGESVGHENGSFEKVEWEEIVTKPRIKKGGLTTG